MGQHRPPRRRHLVFRFPRRALALPAFRRELTVLPRLAPLMPLPVPVPELIAADEEEDRGRSPRLGCCRGGSWPRRPCPTAGGADRDPSTCSEGTTRRPVTRCFWAA